MISTAKEFGITLSNEAGFRRAYGFGPEPKSLQQIEAESTARAKGTAAGTPGGGSNDLIDRTDPNRPIMNTKASNAIKSSAVTAFGGVFNPIDGSISGLSREEGLQVLEIQAAAEQLLLNGEEVSVGAAVLTALRAQKAAAENERTIAEIPSVEEINKMTQSEARDAVAVLGDQELPADVVKAFRAKLQKPAVSGAPTTQTNDTFVGGS